MEVDLDERSTVSSHPAPVVLATEACTADLVTIVGGKAVGLGSLIRSGQNVPASFVVSASAYADYARWQEGGGTGVPPELAAEIVLAYRGLCEQQQSEVVVAVRSSATVEDSSDSSCAGQFSTYLGVTGDGDVLDAVERCWRSALAPHVDAYRQARQIDADGEGVAVVVQELVDAQTAGVMFTRHPRTGDRSLVVVEASYGLGEAVVGGEVVPDLFELNKVTGRLQARVLGSKPFEHRLSHDGHSVETVAVDPARQAAWSIGDETLESLLEMARQLESTIGRGLDIEWAIGSTRSDTSETELFALQVRPITVGRPGAPFVASGSPVDIVLGRLAGRHLGDGGT
jgi:pyruvate,water dikinase